MADLGDVPVFEAVDFFEVLAAGEDETHLCRPGEVGEDLDLQLGGEAWEGCLFVFVFGEWQWLRNVVHFDILHLDILVLGRKRRRRGCERKKSGG